MGGMSCNVACVNGRSPKPLNMNVSQKGVAIFLRPVQGSKPQNQEKRVSESKNPISPRPRKGRFESKIPIFSKGRHMENGDFFDSKRPLLGWEENGGF